MTVYKDRTATVQDLKNAITNQITKYRLKRWHMLCMGTDNDYDLLFKKMVNILKLTLFKLKNHKIKYDNKYK